ncbi:DUF4349 domain-containing protein [Streptomyces sp. NPDC005574]|uniref:DUF4349 domain-containing protein n=1 Tax=Streptomyces sp. NPDC005574 TaxID=3156891 RepID=UPI00339FD8F3
MRARTHTRPVHALAGLLLVSALALAGCGGADSSDSGSRGDGAALSRSDAEEGAQGAAAADSAGKSGGRGATAPAKLPTSRIIRTASLTVQVKDVPKALDEARTTTETAGGYVGRESTSRDERGDEETRVVLRVPVDRYDEVLTDLEGAGRLLARDAKARDVTDQVVDVDSRIASQRASVVRVRELMDRATKLSDVVTLEGELSTREANLESLLAEQASLKDRTSLATITLSLSERPVHRAAADDDPGIADALSGGWSAFVTMLRWIVVALAAVLPFAAVAAVLVLGWLRFARSRSRSPRTAPATAVPGPLPAPRPEPAREGGDTD